MRHDETAVAQGRDATAAGGAAAQMRVLCDAAALSDQQRGRRRCGVVLEVKRCSTEGGERMHACVRANECVTCNAHVRFEPYAICERYIAAHDAVWANLNVAANLCSLPDNCCRVNAWLPSSCRGGGKCGSGAAMAHAQRMSQEELLATASQQ